MCQYTKGVRWGYNKHTNNGGAAVTANNETKGMQGKGKNMKMKKIAGLFLTLVMAIGLVTGCSSNPEASTNTSTEEGSSQVPEEKTDQGGQTQTTEGTTEEGAAPLTGVTIEFLYNLNGEATSDAILAACEQFTYKTGIEVEAIMPGSSFSDTMKTRMAANQLPDIWTTHGWAVARYSEYLEPLNSQPFAGSVKNEIKDLITGSDGSIYTAPIDMDLVGIAYNDDLLKEAGVNIEELTTWADFDEACQKIAVLGKTPIHIGGKDSWTIGNIFNDIAPTLFTNDNEANQQALLDGSFDWSQWDDAAEMLASWNEKGFINTDCLTADYMTSVKAMAKGDVGFAFYGASGIAEVYAINADANIGFMPLPAKDENGKQTLLIGEHFAVGVWKDSAHKEEAMQLLNFLMEEEVCTELASVCGMPSGVTYVTSDTGKLADYYTKYSEAGIETVPYFDRAYLPSGMWNDLCTTGALILSGEDNAVQKATEQMKASYTEKKAQAN